MNALRNEKGFTLIELVMVIVILGILAAVAVPKFTDLSKQAKDAAAKGIVGAVQSGIGIYYANSAALGNAGYPGQLDSTTAANAGPTSPYFTVVLGQGGIQDPSWRKDGQNIYRAPNDCTYIYTPSTGEFLLRRQ